MTRFETVMLWAGITLLALPFLQRLNRKLPVTPAMVYLGLGLILGGWAHVFPPIRLAGSPLYATAIEHLTEAVVLLTLVAAGLKIDRPFDAQWRQVMWRLLGITMLLTILAVAALAHWLLAFPLSLALLLGALLAPTDPVLAEAVQVGPPQQAEPETPVRFALTAESGLNDGLAFPFAYLALRLHEKGLSTDTFWHWFGVDLLLRVGIGVAVGWLMGRVLAWLLFRVIRDHETPEVMDQHFGVYVLGALLTTYALCEALSGYGFIAVFLMAVRGRAHAREHGYHQRSYKFVQQLEAVLSSILLVGLGMFAAGLGLQHLSWGGVVLAGLLLVGVRPLSGYLGLVGSGLPGRQRVAIAFLGIRGLGSFYYLAYMSHHFPSRDMAQVTGAVMITVLFSVLLHGILSERLITWAEQPSTPD
ncbi:MAG: cation:proton antiporter [Candidatus Sericytochromatia bacterium]